jgi:hypothetical protein
MAQARIGHSVVAVREKHLEMEAGGGGGVGEEGGVEIGQDATNGGGGERQTDEDDDYARWQEEIRQAEEEAEAMKAGKGRRYHQDFRKRDASCCASKGRSREAAESTTRGGGVHR